jgi:hypothetical protein
MSKKLLTALNGGKKGLFAKWLNDFKGEPRIAWYPSAGEDLRDLLYLHPGYSARHPATRPEPVAPDIFLHTDYYPWDGSTFLDGRTIHMANRTTVTVKSIEELPRCKLPLDDKIVDFPDGSAATHRVLFLEVEVRSDVLGTFIAPVLYAFVENAAFCATWLLPQESQLSHIVHVRFGLGFGGGKSSGVWLLDVLKKLHCRMFVSDGHLDRHSGDERIAALYPELAGDGQAIRLEPIRVVEGRNWAGHGDVSWNLVSQVSQ